MNHYETLEVSAKASQEVIKAAYKSLIQRYHPDRNPDNTETAEHALRVNQAYEVLSDANKRAAYDIDLKQQLAVHLDNIQLRSNEVLTRHASVAKDSQSYWFLWLLVASIFLSGWWILSFSGRQQSSESGLKKIHQSFERAKDEEARIIPILTTKLTVSLRPSDKSSEDRSKSSETPGKLSEDSEHVLFIPILGVKVGTFDSDKAISYIERNKEMIIEKLAENLVSAEYEELNKNDGEDYLKNIILDSIGEATGTNRREDYPPSPAEAPGRYGAIDILLPKSFSVR